MNKACGGYDMENLDKDFDERLKKYSDEIKKMKIVYVDGRVRYVNRESIEIFKGINNRDKIENQNNMRQNNYDLEYKACSSFKYIINIIIKLIFTCIILISTPFIANSISSMGVNGFISGIGTILIVYFIISFIWLFLE